MNQKEQQMLENLTLDELLLRLNPKDRLRTQGSCVVKLGTLVKNLNSFYTSILKDVLFSQYKKDLAEAFYSEQQLLSSETQSLPTPITALEAKIQQIDLSNTAEVLQFEKFKNKQSVYIIVTSETTRDNFLVTTVGCLNDRVAISRPEIVWSSDKSLTSQDLEELPFEDFKTEEMLWDFVKNNREIFPFSKDEIYFLKQSILTDDVKEKHYSIFLPKGVMI